MNRRPPFVLLPLLALAGCGEGGSSSATSLPELYVNELMPLNHSALADEDGAFEDWLELYNAGDDALELEGYFVSDDPADPFKRRLGAGLRVGAHDVLLLWADSDPEQGSTHLSFKLAAAGETVLVTHPQGEVVDSVEWTDAPADQVFARFPDGSGEPILCATPTPGERNGSACGGD